MPGPIKAVGIIVSCTRVKRRLVGAGVAAVAAVASAAAEPAEGELQRIVVAPKEVTIAARPAVARWGTPVTLSGSVASGKADELVTIQVKECGLPGAFFRAVSSARTHEGGGWSTQTFPRSTTDFRAMWNDSTSAEVTVRARPGVQLGRLSGSRFQVAVVALVPFRGKRVLVQRFNRRTGIWVAVKSVVLTESAAGGSFAWSSAKFRSAVAKGTLMRAVFPLSQARPCYLAGFSNLLRT